MGSGHLQLEHLPTIPKFGDACKAFPLRENTEDAFIWLSNIDGFKVRKHQHCTTLFPSLNENFFSEEQFKII